MKSEKGNITLIVSVVLVIVAGLYFTINAVQASMKASADKIVELERSVKQKEGELDLLREEKVVLEGQLKLQRELNTIQDELIVQRDGEIRTLQSALTDAYKRLPKPLTRAQEAPQSAAQVERSAQRITTIWTLYCADKALSGTMPACQEMLK